MGELEAKVTVVGGGLAGSEAAWQIGERGVHVELWEMRPVHPTPVHKTADLAELVCSNSFRGDQLENAVGLLKEELRRLGSLIMAVGETSRVPGGGAMAVARDEFSRRVTKAIEGHPRITVRRAEAEALPEGIAVCATGPLTSDALARAILALTGEGQLSFFDAAAPIVHADSIDWDQVFRASRYGKGGGEDYLNCPLSREQYLALREALLSAEQHAPKDFEKDSLRFFEGCLPVEELARRGEDTLRFGPLKPVGLIDPRTGREPYAVVQLRQDDRAGQMWNLVGFQTNLRWPEQRRVFGMIPGLTRAEFERYGVMHRNTFLNSPRILLPTLQARQRADLFFAGQLTGTEGYVESAAGGWLAGYNAWRLAAGLEPVTMPRETALGSLLAYIAEANPETFQPMNITFGLLPPLEPPVRDRRRRNRALSERALQALDEFIASVLDRDGSARPAPVIARPIHAG